jgi:heme exporter protein D
MQFDSINAFFNMGGYGFYVWLSYGVAAVAIVLLIIMSQQKHKQIIESIKQRHLREIKRKEAAKQHESIQENKIESSSPPNVVEIKNEPTP